MITSLSLRNFKSHANSIVNFDRGINVVLGKNGSGKTSLLEAIEFALFGQTNLSMKQLVRHGNGSADVSLSFTAGQHNFEVTRKVTSGNGKVKQDASLSRDGVLIAESPTEVELEVQNALKVTQKLYQDATYVRQGEIKKIVELRKGDRALLLDKIFGVTDLECCWSNMRDVMRWVEDRVKSGDERISMLQASLAEFEEKSKRFEAMNKNREVLVKNVGVLSTMLEKVSGSLKKVGEKRKELAGMLEKKTSLENDRDKLMLELKNIVSLIDALAKEMLEGERKKEEMDVLLGKVSGYESAKSSLSFLQKEVNELSILSVQYKKISQKVEDFRKSKGLSSLAEAAKELREFVAKEERLKNSLDAARAICNQRESDIMFLMQKLETCEKEKRDMAKLEDGSVCPLCKQELSAKHKTDLVRKYDASIEEAKGAIKNLRGEQEKGRDELRKSEDELQQLSSKAKLLGDVERMLEMERDAAEMSARISGLGMKEIELKAAEKRFEELGKLRDRYNALKETVGRIEGLTKKRGKLEEEKQEKNTMLMDVNKSLEKFVVDKSALEFIEEQEASLLGEDRRVRERLNTEKGALDNLSSLLPQLEKEVSELGQKRELMQEEEKKAERAKVLGLKLAAVRDGFRALQPYVRSRYITRLSEEATDIFLDIAEKKTLEKIEVDDSYDVYISETTGKRNPVEIYSGGERILVSLSLRTALAKILSSSDLLILDEPTVELDKVHREALVDAITRIGDIGQLIVVTHDDEFANAADNIIYVNNKDGVSSVG